MTLKIIEKSQTYNLAKQQGFTLIEIIIALFVVSIALGAVISTSANSVNHASHIENKTMALWVAENYLTEISATGQWPATGQHSEEISMAGRQWYLQNQVTQTPDKRIRRLDLSVYDDRSHDNQLTTLVAYINKPEEAEQSGNVE